MTFSRSFGGPGTKLNLHPPQRRLMSGRGLWHLAVWGRTELLASSGQPSGPPRSARWIHFPCILGPPSLPSPQGHAHHHLKDDMWWSWAPAPVSPPTGTTSGAGRGCGAGESKGPVPQRRLTSSLSPSLSFPLSVSYSGPSSPGPSNGSLCRRVPAMTPFAAD